MIGSFITRTIMMVFGYAYPAYECFKTVEKNRPDIERLQFWCQYWMIMAVLTMAERLGDTFISWVPMYSEAKLAFILYLWYPKTKGTSYVYSTFLRPFVAKHERDIDRHLNELRTKVGDVAFKYWQVGSVYAQTRLMELLQYVAAQSPSSTAQQGSAIPQKPPTSSFGHRPSPNVNQEPLDQRQNSVTLPANDEDFEIMDTDELTSAPPPRTRSRQRLQKQYRANMK